MCPVRLTELPGSRFNCPIEALRASIELTTGPRVCCSGDSVREFLAAKKTGSFRRSVSLGEPYGVRPESNAYSRQRDATRDASRRYSSPSFSR